MRAPVQVLIVDDDEDDFILARDILDEIRTAEYDVRWLQGFGEAVHALTTAPVDVCLLDYRLGERTGIELLHEVRALGCEVPVIFLSGQTELALDVEAMRAGAEDFLIKGHFTARELERALRYALERAATRAAQRRLTEELRHMQVQAQRSSQAKSTFLASMSHEFRTPLNAILGYSDLLIDQARAGELEQPEEDLARIRSAGTHLLMLVTDILDLSRIESGRLSMAAQRFALDDLVRDVVDAIAPLLRRNDNRFELAASTGLGEVVADATRVRQILFNLLGNAGKFTRQGAIGLAVARRPARHSDFSRHADDQAIDGVECVEFSISDSGIGMTAEQMDRLFEPFSQVDDSGGRRFGGSGLGLAISRRLARMMGGEVWARSEPGRGSTFRLTLPSDITAAPRWRQSEPGAGPGGERSAGQLPVVFVLGPSEALGRELRERLADVRLDFVVEDDLRRGPRLARALAPALIVVELNAGEPATALALGELAREPAPLETRVLVLVVDAPAQFGCLLAIDGVLGAPLQAAALQRLVDQHAPDVATPLHLWSNSAALLRQATDLLRDSRPLAASTSATHEAIDLHLVDLTAAGAAWGLQPASARRVLLVAPDDPRADLTGFAAEMRALVEQSGLPRAELLHALGAAIVGRMALG